MRHSIHPAVRILPPGIGLEELERGVAPDSSGLLHADHAIVTATPEAISLGADGGEAPGLALRKTITVGGGRRDPHLTLEVELQNIGTRPIAGRLAIEWSVNLLGGGNPEAWLEIAGERRAFDTRGEIAATDRLRFGNDWLELTVEQQASGGAALWWYSVDTVAASEQGVERSHQGICLIWSWPLDLSPGASEHVSVSSRVTVARDRAEEDVPAGSDASIVGRRR